MIILGVDPGSRLTGYGIIESRGPTLKHLGHGTLRLNVKATLEIRLHELYTGLKAVIHQYQPEVLVVEKVFFAKNALSTLKLGQARGAVLLTSQIHDLKFAEYSPTEVKSRVVGHGHADKLQVAQMLRWIFGHQEFETADASDALALAVCHAQACRPSVLEKNFLLR